MTDREAIIAFNMVPSMGFRRMSQLVKDAGGSVAEAWRRFDGKIDRNGRPVDVRPELERAAKLNVSIVTILDGAYPASLKELASPPLCLYVSGSVDALCRDSVAMVGTRRASMYGIETAKAISRDLALRGWNVVSGLALGIDAASHEGALSAGGGLTVGILGSALDMFYPEENRALAREIVKAGGAVVSEFPFGRGPDERTFPQRNRIVAALARGVVAVEAPIKSGTLITCSRAKELGRVVMAVPGKVDSKLSAGCNSLLRGGARLITSAEDAMDEISFAKRESPSIKRENLSIRREEPIMKRDESAMKRESSNQQQDETKLSLEEAAVLKEVPYSGAHMDRICEAAQISPATLNPILVSLRGKGLVKFLPGARVMRVKALRSLAVAMLAIFLGALSPALAAVPQFGNKPESISSMQIKAKVFKNAESVPAITPVQRHMTATQGSVVRHVTHFETREIWLMNQRGGVWRSRAGDVMTLSRPSSLIPSSVAEWAERDEIDKAIASSQDDFSKSTKEKLFAWIDAFAGIKVDESGLLQLPSSGSVAAARQVVTGSDSRYAAVFRMRAQGGGLGPWNWIEFRLAEPASAKEGRALICEFLKGVSADAAASSSKGGASAPSDPRREAAKRAISGGGGWWWSENEDYIFLTNLPKSKGAAFVKETQRTMSALRKAYERYVPATHKVGTGVVRVFASREDYGKYIKVSASGDAVGAMQSIGLWDPSREELLVQYLDDKAESLKTMRHEAFHQYVYYATGCGNHMTWFNEGHATLFENVRYNASNGQVRVLCSGSRAEWTGHDPERVAALIPRIIRMDRESYYSGDVNAHYVAGWALCYFLQKGCWKLKGFEPYREVIPTYLKGISDGLDPQEANERAWAKVEGRDISADFLKFWRNRKSAEAYEPLQ